MRYIDIHCHLDSADYDTDREAVLERMKEKETEAITIGADFQSSIKAVEIAEQNENVWACIGVHPDNTPQPPLNLRGGKQSEGVILGEAEFEKLVTSPKVVGIGECGLDYFRLDLASAKAVADKQKEIFERQIQFAIKHNKSLMLHVREAYEDALEILEAYKKEAGEKLGGNVHFFAGDIEMAKKFLDLEFTMSFTGVITFASGYDEVIKYIPQNSIMSETDAPWVAPVPFRGERNEPIYVIEVVERLAEIRKENFDALNNSIIRNAKRVFGI